MKLSISNIAWSSEYDEEMYIFLKENGFDGIEIAPTRLFSEPPYDKVLEAKQYKNMLFNQYGLEISSIQSIWYGRTEQIFYDINQRKFLIEYTKRAFDFAKAMECKNLVFGCPKNRSINSTEDRKIAIEFFFQLGELAKKFDTILALEANPTIYGTNFLNTTLEVYDFIKEVKSSGIRLNYDLGTVIYNNEEVIDINNYLHIINHVHISEPNLEQIIFGKIQESLMNILLKRNYQKFVSIEMKNFNSINLVKNKIIELKKRKVGYNATR